MTTSAADMAGLGATRSGRGAGDGVGALSTRERQLRAADPRLVPEEQDELASDVNQLVRGLLARNPSLSARPQRVLAKDPSVNVRRGLAKGVALEPEVAALLAGDESRAVQEALASNATTTFTDAFPLACLELSERGRAFIRDRLEQEEVEPECSGALRPSWTGTLTELIETARELSGAAV
jgi:hypothetical protein